MTENTMTPMTGGLCSTTLPIDSFRHGECEIFSGSSLSSFICHSREVGTAEHCPNLKEPSIKEAVTVMALIFL